MALTTDTSLLKLFKLHHIELQFFNSPVFLLNMPTNYASSISYSLYNLSTCVHLGQCKSQVALGT